MPWNPELSTGSALRPAAAYPLADLLSEWLTEVASHFAAPERARRAAERLTGWWHPATVADISVRACRAYAADRAASPSTVRRELVSVLVSALSHAVRSERLAGTERPFVWRPPGAAVAPARWLTRADAARLLDAIRLGPPAQRGWLERFVLLGLVTAARSSALLGLRTEHIDWSGATIDFRAGTDRPDRRKARAVQPIPPVLRDALGDWARESRSGFVIERTRFGRAGPVRDPRRPLAAAARRAGIGHVHPHMLRHTCATWLRQGGASMPLIAGWLGHRNLSSTERYAHHAPAADHPAPAILADACPGFEPRRPPDGKGEIMPPEAPVAEAPRPGRGRAPGTRLLGPMPEWFGRAEIWLQIRRLGEFTIRDLAERPTVDSHPREVRKYVRALRRAGHVRRTGTVRERLGTTGTVRTAPVYRLVGDHGPEAPRLRADGTLWDPNRRRGFEPRWP